MSETALHNGLIFLVYTTGIVLILISVFLIKLLIDLSRFTKNMNDTLNVVKNELEPTLSELKASLKSINAFVKSTDEKVDTFKKALTDTLGFGISAATKIKNVSGAIITGAMKGFITAYKLFSK